MRLIDADALKRILIDEIYTKQEIDNCGDKDWMLGNNSAIKEARRIVDRMQTVDPVRHGHWVKGKINGQDAIWCSNCRNIVYQCESCGFGRGLMRYCHVCGTYMIKEVQHEID